VIPIYDIKEAQGLIFYTMPFIDGPTLAAKLERRGALPPKVAQRVLMELCDAVAATHRAGILHRDIKPSNVILEGALEKVLLMDFGIAHVLGAGYDTESGQVLGTPTYMSPEHAGGAGMVDERSDIYSLGVVGYHLLTGRPPFEGDSPMAVVVQHLSATPVPIRKINPSVPFEIADAVERALEKKPLDRHQNVMDMWEQLGRATFFRDAGEPLPPQPPRVLGHGTALAAFVSLLLIATGWLSTRVRALDLTVLAPWQWLAAGVGAAAVAVTLSPAVQAWARDWRPSWAFWGR
jgi:serine/threonine-protein kinase